MHVIRRRNRVSIHRLEKSTNAGIFFIPESLTALDISLHRSHTFCADEQRPACLWPAHAKAVEGGVYLPLLSASETGGRTNANAKNAAGNVLSHQYLTRKWSSVVLTANREYKSIVSRTFLFTQQWNFSKNVANNLYIRYYVLFIRGTA